MKKTISHEQYTPNTNYYTPTLGFTPYLRICGKGVLHKKDAFFETWPNPYDPGNYTSIELDDGITSVEAGFLETFFHLEKLILSASVQSIDDTKELSSMLTNNHVIVRGLFDTFAEEFAKIHHLKFIHSNIFLAESSDQYETDVWTLRFEDSGLPYLHCNAHGHGFMGGEQRRELPKDLLDHCTIEQFANQFGNNFTEQILQNKILQNYLDRINSGWKP